VDSFNPHPTLRQGATPIVPPPTLTVTGFNPHPTLRQGATLFCFVVYVVFYWRFNPHPTLRQGATPPNIDDWDGDHYVSILTPPCGRVQLWSWMISFAMHEVSILTPPCGRVQPEGSLQFNSPHGFQSSPHLAAGCNLVQVFRHDTRRLTVSILTPPCGRVQLSDAETDALFMKFQSSPHLAAGCNDAACDKCKRV